VNIFFGMLLKNDYFLKLPRYNIKMLCNKTIKAHKFNFNLKLHYAKK
jgi:hypothetical protein